MGLQKFLELYKEYSNELSNNIPHANYISAKTVTSRQAQGEIFPRMIEI